MGIEQNFNRNLKKSVKKQTPSLPTGSKFILQQLVKNIDEVEDMLEDEVMVEYNVGDLKQVIRNLSEGDKSYCKKNKLGKCCDGGDGHGCGKWVEDPDNKKCTCSYEGPCCSGQPASSKGSKDVEKELNEGPVCDAAGKSGSCGNCGPDGGNGDFTWQDSLGFCVCKETGGGICQSVIPGGEVPATGLKNAERGKKADKDVEQEMGEATTTASSGAYSTPRFWAKDKKNQRFNNKRWMPGAKFVKVKDKCKKFPYCNQGDITALEIWEKEIMRESAKNVSKKTGKPESEVREMIEKELAEIIRRSFYKSPIKDLVGTGKMDTPIGKMFSMSGNKPK